MERAERFGVPVVVPDVDHHVEALAAVGGHRLVEGGKERRYQGLDLGGHGAGPQPHPRPEAPRGDRASEDVDPKVHPRPVEGLLNSLRDP